MHPEVPTSNLKQQKTISHYTITGTPEISETAFRELVESIESPQAGKPNMLGGRGAIIKTDITGIGNVIIKPYLRGGVIKYFSENRYFKWGKTRGEREYEWLEKIRALGIPAPEPVCFIMKGNFFYRAWLVTKEIPHQYSLATLSLEDKKKALACLERTLERVDMLIKNRIYHVDFHPGNILIDETFSPCFIDFDKARIFNGSKNSLCEKYICRWDRAISKYQLPESLSQAFKKHLQKSN